MSEFRSTFDGYETFYFEKKMYVPMSEENDSMEQVKFLIKFVSRMLIIEYQDMRDSIEAALFSMLEDLMEDPDIKCLSDSSNYSSLELYPYYAQITSGPRNGIFGTDEKTSRPPTATNGTTKSLAFSTTTKSMGPSTVAPRYKKEDILGSLEFQNFAESVLETTLYNLMQEANEGEFELTKYPMLFMGQS